MKNIRNKVLMFLVLSIVSVNICACSKNDELAVYKTNMESFFTEVSSCNDAMNSIDPNADDAPSQLVYIS